MKHKLLKTACIFLSCFSMIGCNNKSGESYAFSILSNYKYTTGGSFRIACWTNRKNKWSCAPIIPYGMQQCTSLVEIHEFQKKYGISLHKMGEIIREVKETTTKSFVIPFYIYDNMNIEDWKIYASYTNTEMWGFKIKIPSEIEEYIYTELGF